MEEKIINKIYVVRGKTVMLDIDLAEMYAVETKQLKRQVKRNKSRFPPDFMFVLKRKEFEILRSQIGTSSWGGIRYMPMAFTEQGVAMLSSVLNSGTAVRVNIQIVRAFTKMRELMVSHRGILLKLEKMEKEIIKQDYRLEKSEVNIRQIFEALKILLGPPFSPGQRLDSNVMMKRID